MNFVYGLPTFSFQGTNSDSGGNYQLIDVESTVRMGFPLGITISGTTDPPEEWDSAGKIQLMEADSYQQDHIVQKILKAETMAGSASTDPIVLQRSNF
jgi:hypothetical protein